MWALLGAMAFGGPDEDLRARIADIRGEVSPVVVGATEDRVRDIVSDLDVLVVPIASADLAFLDRVRDGLGARCALLVTRDGAEWRIAPVGSCDPTAAAILPPSAEIGAPPAADRTPAEVDAKRWALARGIRTVGVVIASSGMVLSTAAYGVAVSCDAPELGCLGPYAILIGSAIVVTGPGVVLTAVGHGLEDGALAGVYRTKWPGQLGAAALAGGAITSALVLFAPAAARATIPVALLLTGAGVVLEGAQLAIDTALVPPAAKWALVPTPRGIGFVARW